MEASNLPAPRAAAALEPIPELTTLGMADEPEGDLARSVNVLMRRKNIIIGCVVLITAICVAGVYAVTPLYTAEAALVLEPRKTQVIDMQSVLSGLPADISVVRSEVEILKSAGIAKEVIRRARLAEVPELNAALVSDSPSAKIRDLGESVVAQIGTLFGASPPPVAPGEAPEMQGMIRALQSRTDIANDGRSYYLRVRVESADPKLAAKIANIYTEVYLDKQLEAKFQAVQRANKWLDTQVADLKTKVEASDQAVQAYRTQHHLVASKEGTVATQQMSEINSELIKAEADLAQKESTLAQMRGASSSSVLGSPLIQRLGEQRAALVTQEAELSSRYKPDHPEMIKIKSQERDLDRAIGTETSKIAQGAAGDVAAARAKAGALRASLNQLQAAAQRQDSDSVELQQLQREADANRTVYQDFLNRFKQTTATEDIQQPDARLVAAAEIPDVPSFPRKGPLIGAAFAGSLIIGFFAAFAVERLDNTFRTGEQLERASRVPVLAVVPNADLGATPQNEVIEEPFSVFSETIRMVRTALRYSASGAPPKVVMVTSSVPEEGKTVMTISLARSAAYSGVRTLLIDCDLRKPSLAKMLGVPASRGVLALFDENADASDVIEVDKASGMHFMTAAEGPPNTQTLLASKPLEDFINAKRAEYDLIVIDSPPVMAVSDAMVLSHLVDTSILLVRWASTPRPVVLGALRNFRALGGQVAGTVLSRVDLMRHAAYHSGDLVGYYGEAAKYGYGYASTTRKA